MFTRAPILIDGLFQKPNPHPTQSAISPILMFGRSDPAQKNLHASCLDCELLLAFTFYSYVKKHIEIEVNLDEAFHRKKARQNL